jgi:glycosyltransferase involved in cell wall biosynthesis
VTSIASAARTSPVRPAHGSEPDRRLSGERALRVLNVYSGNLFGGVERLFSTFARHSRPGDLEFEFALCFDGRLRESLGTLGVVQHDLGPVRARFPWSRARARARLRAILAAGAYDAVVVHSAWAQAMFASVVRETSLPLVFYMHDVANGTHWLERWAKLYPPDLVVSNSHFTVSSAPRLYPGVPATSIYAPVDVTAPALSAAMRGEVRASFRTRDEDVVIVQVSRLEAWKGHALMLDALGRMRANPRWVMWVVGGPQRDQERRYLDSLHSQAKALGIADRVRFLGERSDVPRVLAAADVFCQPNLGPEPFGIVFIEALACSLPVVATAMGGVVEIIDETCGVLTPADPVALAAALTPLVDDAARRHRLGSAGPARARLLCEPARQMDELTEVIRSARVSRR